MTSKSDECSENDLQETNKEIFDKLSKENYSIEFDMRKFTEMCLYINKILSKHQLFLRIYEMGNKFREVRLKDSKEQKIIKQRSSCVRNKFDGFNAISVHFNKKMRRNFKAINIIYKPVKKKSKSVFCYATTGIAKAYGSIRSTGKDNELRHGFAWECYYCSKLFGRQDRYTLIIVQAFLGYFTNSIHKI